MELSRQIKKYRTEANLSQEELAERVGVRRETIARLEKGTYNPSLKLAMDISKVFRKSVEEVFKFEIPNEVTLSAFAEGDKILLDKAKEKYTDTKELFSDLEN